MNFFVPRASFTVHIPNTGPVNDPARGHLYVILSEKSSDGFHLLVPVCSLKSKSDRTCILGVGDHPFIKHASFAAYNLMELFAADIISARVNSGAITYEGVIDAQIFARLHGGVAQSPLAAPRLVKFLFG